MTVPIYKTGNRSSCENYRGIASMDIASVPLLGIIICWLPNTRGRCTRKIQSGLWSSPVCIEKMITCEQMLERKHTFHRALICLPWSETGVRPSRSWFSLRFQRNLSFIFDHCMRATEVEFLLMVVFQLSSLREVMFARISPATRSFQLFNWYFYGASFILLWEWWHYHLFRQEPV